MKKKIILSFDSLGYITEYTTFGARIPEKEYVLDTDTLEVIPDSSDQYEFDPKFEFENAVCYKLQNNFLVYDEQKAQLQTYNKNNEDFRMRRAMECFPIINRGQLWYESLSNSQRDELKNWYQSWLDVTETQVVPQKPAWIE